MAKIVVGADHGGVELKDALAEKLRAAGHLVVDVGTKGNDSVDYPDYAFAATEKITSGEAELGLLVCGTGIGMSIAANKVTGIRCAKLNNVAEGRLAAEHNNANMIAFGGRMIDEDTAWSATVAWLEHSHSEQRHQRRVAKIDAKDGS